MKKPLPSSASPGAKRRGDALAPGKAERLLEGIFICEIRAIRVRIFSALSRVGGQQPLFPIEVHALFMNNECLIRDRFLFLQNVPKPFIAGGE